VVQAPVRPARMAEWRTCRRERGVAGWRRHCGCPPTWCSAAWRMRKWGNEW